MNEFYAGYDRAVNTILETFESLLGECYEFQGAEDLFEDFADDIGQFDISSLSVDTYDSDSDEVKRGIRQALAHLKSCIEDRKNTEKPTGAVTITW